MGTVVAAAWAIAGGFDLVAVSGPHHICPTYWLNMGVAGQTGWVLFFDPGSDRAFGVDIGCPVVDALIFFSISVFIPPFVSPRGLVILPFFFLQT